MSAKKERGRIGRNFIKTYCDCRVLNSDNNIEEMEISFLGYCADKIAAQQKLSKMYPNTAIQVTNLTHVIFYASMTVENFIKNADDIQKEKPYSTTEMKGY